MFKKIFVLFLIVVGMWTGSIFCLGQEKTFAGLRDSSGHKAEAEKVTPNSDAGRGSWIGFATKVDVQTVVNGVTDFIVLPSLADVPVGHEVMILCNAGGAFELRTPAASAEEINSEDCDGTKEYLCTDTQVLRVIKISTTVGWMANAWSAIGTAVVAVVPD